MATSRTIKKPARRDTHTSQAKRRGARLMPDTSHQVPRQSRVHFDHILKELISLYPETFLKVSGIAPVEPNWRVRPAPTEKINLRVPDFVIEVLSAQGTLLKVNVFDS